ncbi:methyl-accepting chemotaxis protein [Clostridium sp. ZS2-4]|uniref:methyl-accepting chemotaxis protein n=1 Tax=Clostridium sp. ZS2-4 TaxID=2987703 RepID=UPI00227D0A23|nr:methyl-accepting chemotaxis protein [Clostridium sp. ZS2-4]MCY6353742.1 methyl-accepting chemotaxis protein [Clostridium sp. ZS2-4]
MLNSFKKKIIAGFILVTVICGVLLTSISLYETNKGLTDQMEKTGQTIGKIARQTVSKLKVEDVSTMSKIFSEIQNESSKDIAYISFADENTKLLAHSDSSKIGTTGAKDEMFDRALNGETVGGYYKRADGEWVYNVSMPFYDEDKVVGIISVGISTEEMNVIFKQYVKWVLIVAFIILAVSLTIGIILARNIVKPLNLVVRRMEKVADGDFTIEFHAKSDDEIGNLMKALDYVMHTLRDLIGGIQIAAGNLDSVCQNLSASCEEIAASGEQVSKSAEEVANASSEQAVGVSDTAEYVENFSKQLDLIHNGIDKVAKNSNNIKKSADIGGKDLKSLVSVIDDMKLAFENSAEKIAFLDNNVGKITEVMDVINAVAEQTNLLALNAAIEAARAGEAGKGFSVVADEIRKLAEQVLESSKSITELVQTIMANTKEVSQTTELVSNKMKTEMQTVGSTVESFKHIVNQVEETLPHIENVYMAVDKSIKEKNRIVEKIENINCVSQETAASTEEIAASVESQSASVAELSASAEELTSMADEFAQKVSRFKIEKFSEQEGK